MLITYVKMAIAAAMMLAQPARHDDDRGQVSVGVAVVASRVSSTPTQPVSSQSSSNEVARREVAIRGEKSKPAAHPRAAKQVAAHPGEVPADTTDRSDHSEAVRGDAEKTAAGSPNDADRLVAILLVRPEIKSVSDLAGKSIAIDDRQSPSSASLRTAIAAAGAAGVQLSEGQTTAINRVVSGEVPAAVLTLESPEAAETFPEIEGYKIFRIPLSPRSVKVRVDRP